MNSERLIEEVLTAHEGSWALLAHMLRALETDEEAAFSLHRRVRNAMGCALLAGYEGREPTPKRPSLNAHHKAEQWIGMQLLRDIGPRGLAEVDWLGLARSLTSLAGPRIAQRRPGAPPPAIAEHIERLEATVAARDAQRRRLTAERDRQRRA
jgi:hypothetical protein